MVNDTIVDTWDNLLTDWTAHENGTEKMKICTSILDLRNFMTVASVQFEAYSGAHSLNIGESMKAAKVKGRKRGKMLTRLTKEKKEEEKGTKDSKIPKRWKHDFVVRCGRNTVIKVTQTTRKDRSVTTNWRLCAERLQEIDEHWSRRIFNVIVETGMHHGRRERHEYFVTTLNTDLTTEGTGMTTGGLRHTSDFLYAGSTK